MTADDKYTRVWSIRRSVETSPVDQHRIFFPTSFSVRMPANPQTCVWLGWLKKPSSVWMCAAVEAKKPSTARAQKILFFDVVFYDAELRWQWLHALSRGKKLPLILFLSGRSTGERSEHLMTIWNCYRVQQLCCIVILVTRNLSRAVGEKTSLDIDR